MTTLKQQRKEAVLKAVKNMGTASTHGVHQVLEAVYNKGDGPKTPTHARLAELMREMALEGALIKLKHKSSSGHTQYRVGEERE